KGRKYRYHSPIMANILAVDDELGIRDLLSEILNDEGRSVAVAENAAQARAARQNETPDLVLLDVWMPDTDGVTLLKEWSTAGLLTMPVIMMSGHATIDTDVAATKIGAYPFLEKPITLQKLLTAVEKGLARNAPPLSAPAPMRLSTGEGLIPASVPVAEPPGPLPQQNFQLDKPLREARDEFEKAYFEYHLAHENGSMT